ncbi:MAG: hypothetical protein ACK55Z_22500, partial [bacterium]
MPRHVSSSIMEEDNLRMMQSVLSPACMLMGKATSAAPAEEKQGSANRAEEVPKRTSRAGQGEWRMRGPSGHEPGFLKKMLVMTVLL